jgi:uncharacterized ion transporter superfamily protein YfcC
MNLSELLVFIMLIVMMILLTGCGYDRNEDGVYMTSFNANRRICVDGFTYVELARGITVVLDKTGHTIPCSMIPKKGE